MVKKECKTDVYQKIIASLWAALLFLLISSKFMYSVTNSLGLKTMERSGCPSTLGYILHTIVFTLLVFGSMYLTIPDV